MTKKADRTKDEAAKPRVEKERIKDLDADKQSDEVKGGQGSVAPVRNKLKNNSLDHCMATP